MRVAGVLLLAALLAACATPAPLSHESAHDGVLDLRAWDFAARGPAELRGAWRVAWSRLDDGATPRDACDDDGGSACRFATIPSGFHTQRSGAWADRLGYATYTLRVRLPALSDAAADPWMLFSGDCRSSYRITVRDAAGHVLAHPIATGIVGSSPESQVPGDAQKTTTLTASARNATDETDEIVVYLEVANFHAGFGGVWIPPRIGPAEIVTRDLATKLRANLIAAGLIVMMGLYHLTLFGLRRKETSPLYFGIFCVALAARSLGIDSRAAGFDAWWLHLKLEILGWYLGVPALVLFFRSLFPHAFSRRIAAIAVAPFVLFSVCELALPHTVATRLEAPAQWSTLAVIVVVFVAMVRMRARTARDAETAFVARIMAAGFLVLAVSGVYDVLQGMHVIEGPWLSSFGLCVFVALESLTLAILNQRARTASEELAEALREKTRELHEKNVALSRLDKLKNEFLANTSHELRTPLHGIIGLAESLIDGAAGLVNDAGRETLAMIVTSGRRLASLVNDILDFSKLRHRDLELARAPVDVRALVDVVLALAAHASRLSSARPVTLENAIPEGLAKANADEGRLQQILMNLVGNALKFTAKGSVRIAAREVSGGLLEVSVTDTGIGIPEEAHGRIFESFEQEGGGDAREFGGTGLGLAITRRLVELHGGHITVASKVGVGSTFAFTLPTLDTLPPPALTAPLPPTPTRSPAAAPTTTLTPPPVRPPQLSVPPSSPSVPRWGRAMRVLAADDDPVNLLVLEGQLRTEGFDVVKATDGVEALAKIEREGPFDLVLLDVMMPKMTGYEVCRRLRETRSIAELPVLLLTAKNQLDDLAAGFEAGANDYLEKPFAKKELLARIEAHVELSETNRALSRFVPREFLELLGRRSVVDVRLGDSVKRTLTVLFTDVRNFTQIAEAMTPEETFAFVNAWWKRIGPVVRAGGGFIDKYIGDAVMALFPGGPDAALRAAIAIQREVAAYNESARHEGRASISMGVGVGLHVGPTMLGTVGEAERFEATAISDTVNIAARIEALTKDLGARVLVSDALRGALADRNAFSMRPLGPVRLRGKTRELRIHEVLDADPEPLRRAKEATLEPFASAVEAMARGDLREAVATLDAILTASPGDLPARHLRARCLEAPAEGPPSALVLEVT